MVEIPSISVFMPACNEERTVGKNLDVLISGVQRGKINHAIIVVDGSIDKTPEIVFSKLGLTESQIKALTKNKRGTLILPNGFIIIHHKEPEGKGRNFVEAMFTLKGRNNFFRKKNSVIVNIDADALNLEEKIITGIAKEITKKDVPMLLGRHIERGVDVRVFGGIASPSATGFRVMKAKALEPLFSMSKAWLRTFPRKFGMDHALNILIYRKTIVKGTKIDTSKIPVSGYELFHEKPGKHESDAVQVRQRADVRQRFFGNRKVQFSRPEELAFHERKGKAPKQHQRKIK